MVLDTMIFGLIKILTAVLAFGIGRAALLIMDRALEKSESPFATWLKEADDAAKSRYYAARIIALCLLIGLAIS